MGIPAFRPQLTRCLVGTIGHPQRLTSFPVRREALRYRTTLLSSASNLHYPQPVGQGEPKVYLNQAHKSLLSLFIISAKILNLREFLRIYCLNNGVPNVQ
jgi:hypothetical protein